MKLVDLMTLYKPDPGTVIPVFQFQVFRTAGPKPVFFANRIPNDIQREAIVRMHNRMKRNNVVHIQVHRYATMG
jgi:hypothetical protein